MSEDILKLILPAGSIPMCAKVTKIRGDVIYTLRDAIKVYDSASAPRSIKAKGGAVFLASDTGDFHVVGSDTELVWLATNWQVLDFLGH